MALSNKEIETLSKTYIEEFRKSAKTEAFVEVHLSVDQVIRSNPHQGMALVKHLIFHVQNDDELCYIAAGPLENLIGYHAESLREELEIFTRRTPIMRHAMRNVWHKDLNTPAGKLMKDLEYLLK